MTGELLSALHAYADAHDGWLSCDFELATDGAHLAERLLDDAEVARSFEVFGHDEMLGLYARWVAEDGAPVVYLASDWLDTGVLAEDLKQFVALLTLGRDRVGMLGDWQDDQDPCEGIDDFRAWAEQEFGVATPDEAAARALVERARAAHPDVKTWIEERRAG